MTIAKRTVDGPSLVFVAGVEGTGHHMLCAALAPRCGVRTAGSSSSACFKVDKRLESLASTLVYSSMSRWRSDRAAIVERLRGYHSLSAVFSNSSQRRMMLQCTDSLGSGLGFKMSYPDDTLSLRRDSEKEGKATAHGDVGVLAELAEEAQIDLRIVVLTRDLASSARSRMQPNATAAGAAAELAKAAQRRSSDLESRWPHMEGGLRRWQAMLRWPPGGSMSRRPLESQARILADQECLLASQLRGLDWRFYRVLSYENVVREPRREAQKLARFLRVGPDALAQSFAQRVRPSRRAPPSPDERDYVASLRSRACDVQTVWDEQRGGRAQEERLPTPAQAQPGSRARRSWL